MGVVQLIEATADTHPIEATPGPGAQSGVVHGVFRVIAGRGIQVLPQVSSPSAVSGSTYAQQMCRLRFRVAAVARDDEAPSSKRSPKPSNSEPLGMST